MSELDREPLALDLLSNEVDSFEKLEVLALLGRSQGGAMPLDALVEGLKVRPAVAHEAIVGLIASGLLARAGDKLGLSDRERTRGVTALLRVYEHDKVGVLNFMSKRSLARIRRSIPDAFANAFRLRDPGSTDKPGGKSG